MKKIIPIFTFLIVAASISAQFNFNTNTNIGQTLNAVNTQNKDTFTVHFNTAIPSASWTFNAATQVYTVTQRKCQTQRGLQVNVYGDAIATGNGIISSDFECRDYGGNRNPQHVASLDSLLSVLNVFDILLSTANSKTKPAACLFDVAGNTANQAFGAYPAHYKRVEYGFRYNFAGRSIIDDISFELETYALGNTGKTATYKLEVYAGSVSEANKIGEVANIYTTGEAKKTINLAQAIGQSPSVFTNKAIFFFLKTMGTTNSEGVTDAVPNAIGVMDPFIVIDNMTVTYQNPQWIYPVGVLTNAVFNHNNGSPVFVAVSSTDFSGGTPVNVIAGSDQPVKVRFNSADRVGTLTITEANAGGVHATAYTFTETGAIKRNNGSGQYIEDVSYTRTINQTSGVYTLTVAAPTSGSTNDDIEVTMLVNAPLDATRSIRLEVNNGVRFWYNVAAIGIRDVGTSVDKANAAKLAYVLGRTIVSEAGAMQIFNINGQLVKSVNATEAHAGVSVEQGIYIVKSGSEVQKVIVK